jgi:AcrR family transcriptional regulator
MAVTKGELTRQRIIEAAAPVFNQRGYWGVTMSEIMGETGLEKGGIYHHFESKDELALAAFDHNTELVGELIRQGLARHDSAPDRLIALVDVYRAFAHDPPFPGGCPILNTTVEADDSHPALHERARETLTLLRQGTVQRIIERGVTRGELATDIDPEALATLIIATIEGGLLLSHAYDDPSQFDLVADHLDNHIRSLQPRGKRP